MPSDDDGLEMDGTGRRDGAREEREADGAERTSGQPLGVLEDTCDVGDECLLVREILSGPRGA